MCTDFDNMEGLKDECFLPALIMTFMKGKITDGMLIKTYGLGASRANRIISGLQELGVIEGGEKIIKYLCVSPNALPLYIESYKKILDNDKRQMV